MSNEQPTQTDVYFDDVKITYTPTNILQYNEYYAHGAPNARSWTRDNTTTNNFLANGGTELNTTTALYDLDYRNYDPILGRMNGVDPMADKYGSLTPYNYSFNSPTMHNDVSGADPTDQTPYWIEESMQRNARRYKGEVIDTYNQFAGLMRTTPQKMFEERSAGGYTAWSPSSNSLMSYGGITGAEYSQMYDDARNLTPQEYGEKYGTSDLGKVIINELKTNLSSLMSDYRGSFGYWRQVGLAGTAGIHIKFFSLTSFSNLQQTQGDPTRAELNERFGDSFEQLFRAPFLQRFSGQNVQVNDIEKFIGDFEYSSLEDKTGSLQLKIAWSRVTMSDPSASNVLYNNVFDWTMGNWTMPYDKRGSVFNPTSGLGPGQDSLPIYFKDAGGNQYMVGVTLYLPRIF